MTEATSTKKILVVCTGNTCRSPMAEALLKRELQKKSWDHLVEVTSCGTGTRDGMPATSEAVFVMQNRELDIRSHRSKRVKPEFLKDATVILAMNPSHTETILAANPEYKDKIITMNIPDPIGMSLKTYEETVVAIQESMTKMWPEIAAKLGLK